MARNYSRITLYVAREFFFSFIVAFLFFFFIFFINQMLLLAEQILTRQVPPLDVARLIFYSLPSIVAFSFPFGALVGALMAIGGVLRLRRVSTSRWRGFAGTSDWIPGLHGRPVRAGRCGAPSVDRGSRRIGFG